MRALVVYESMYGNTHNVAVHIADGLRPFFDVTVVPVAEATAELVKAADVLVVGGPTHVHSVSSHTSRNAARGAAEKDDGLNLDPDARGPGLRDWFHGLGDRHGSTAAAAFDTRVVGSPVLTGRASKGIARRLVHHGFRVAAEPESFLVDRNSHLLDGEAERATTWGAELSAALSATGSV